MFENKNHDNPTIKVVADQEIEIAGSKSKHSQVREASLQIIQLGKASRIRPVLSANMPMILF
jgi:hypothetical protein